MPLGGDARNHGIHDETPRLGARLRIFFLLKAIKEALGVLTDEIPDLAIQLLCLCQSFLHIFQIQLGQHVIRSGILVLVPINGPYAGQRNGG